MVCRIAELDPKQHKNARRHRGATSAGPKDDHRAPLSSFPIARQEELPVRPEVLEPGQVKRRAIGCRFPHFIDLGGRVHAPIPLPRC